MMTGTSGRAAFARSVPDAMQGAIRRLCKIHREAIVTQIAPELLAKQHLDIGLIVNNENKEAHEFVPALLVAALRGSITLNSVNSSG
jgi:hypothetical protein